MIRTIGSQLRLTQWSKNFFIFIPAFFAEVFFEDQHVPILILSFLSFSLVASAIYCLNDYKDFDKDRLHPTKKKRPYALGKLTSKQLALTGSITLTLGLAISIYINQNFTLLLVSYIVLNILYTFLLKHISLIDIFIIAIGFQLRIFAGSIIVDVPTSKWLIIMTFLLSLFLAFAKRREDILIEESGEQVRSSSSGYNKEFVLAGMVITSSVTIIAYIMYTLAEEVIERIHPQIYLSSSFVILGILRYIQITLVEEKSSDPTTVLFNDRIIQLSILGWGVFLGYIIYGYNISIKKLGRLACKIM